MKFYQMLTLLVLSSLLTYKAEAIRLGKVTLSTSNHQAIKIASIKGSSDDQDHQSIPKTPETLSGIIDRKLMTENRSSSTTNSISKNDEHKHDRKPEVQSGEGLVGKEKASLFNSSPEISKHWKKEVMITKQYPDAIDIAGMDYTAARKKSPIHN